MQQRKRTGTHSARFPDHQVAGRILQPVFFTFDDSLLQKAQRSLESHLLERRGTIIHPGSIHR